ncbi:MAG: hypothetical protein E7052_03100 [Lentisphaerae bacterium]|nr:hypothetical protein [Lentisphaerota bacterium]
MSKLRLIFPIRILITLMLLTLAGSSVCGAGNESGYPLKSYEVKVSVECDSPAAAAQADLRFLPLPPGKKVAFSCRWDDNNVANLRMKKLMQQYGYKGTFYLLQPSEKFKQTVLGELCKDGFTIGNHTLHHYNLSSLTPNGIFYEMMANRILLERLSHQTVTAFIFPGGSFATTFYPETAHDFSTCMRRTGILGGPGKSTPRLNKIPGNDFFTTEGRIITPGDRNTSTKKFDFYVKKFMPAPGKTAHMNLGIHVWHSDKDFAELEKSMKKYAHRPDWWYCNENEFLAYAYMHKYAKVIDKKVNANQVEFTVQLPMPEYLGSDTPLWAECSGKSVAIAHTRKLPAKIAVANPNGSNEIFPEIKAKLSFPEPDRVRLEVVNTAAPLENVRFILHLPPDFAEETIFTEVGTIHNQYSREWKLTPHPAGKSTGIQLTALQMDFLRNQENARLWVQHTLQTPPQPSDSLKVFCAQQKFTTQDLEKLSLPDTALDPAVFAPASTQLNYRETVFKVSGKVVNKESLTVVAEFTGGQAITLQGTLPDTIYCNGQKLHPRQREISFTAPAGKCRIVFQHLNSRRPVRFVQLIIKKQTD